MLRGGQVKRRSAVRITSERVSDLLDEYGQFNRVEWLKLENLVANARGNERTMLVWALIGAAVGPRKLARRGGLRGFRSGSRTCDINYFAVLGAGYVLYRKLVCGRGELAEQ